MDQLGEGKIEEASLRASLGFRSSRKVLLSYSHVFLEETKLQKQNLEERGSMREYSSK